MGFLVFLFIVGILIMVHELGHFLSARKLGVKVEKFSLGFGKVIFKYKRNDVEYYLGLIPFGGYVKLAGDSQEEYKGLPYEYLSQPIIKRFLIVFSGPLLNYLLGVVLFGLIFFTGYPVPTTKVGKVLEGFGAEEAGIKPGDKILYIDEKNVTNWREILTIIRSKNPGDTVNLRILRDNQELKIKVKLKEKELQGLGGERYRVGLLGIAPSEEIIKLRYGFFKAFWSGIREANNLIVISCVALFKIISGKMDIRSSISGPLGIFFITHQATKIGLTAVINLLAILSISLFIFNLLPFPLLDGGHILLLVLEKLRKKPLSIKAERVINQIGFAFIITLAILVTYNDILRLWKRN